MDFFTQVAAQVRDLYSRLTFSQKMAFVLLVTVVVCALVIFTGWGSRGEYVGVTREPLGAARAEVLTALDAAGIRYREVVGAIEVPASQYNEAMAILATHGIVPTEQINIRLADIAKDDKMFRTAEDKRAQRLLALQDWLGQVISHMENIRGASVAIDAPDSFGLALAEERGSASVNVILQSGVERLSKEQVNGIAALVAGVRRTIRKSDVSIIDNHGHEYTVAGEDVLEGGVASGRHDIQMTYECRLAREVQDMLSYFSPVKVMVRLKIDFDRKTEEEHLVEKGRAVEVKTTTETLDSTGATPAAAGGESGPGQPLTVGGGVTSPSTETKESRTAESVPYKKITTIVKAPGEVLDMSVAVFVPREQVIEQIKGRGKDVGDKPADAEISGELENIRQSIMNMLLVDEKDKNKISVLAVTFPKRKPVEAAAEAGFLSEFWPKHGRTTVLGVLSLLALLLLWRMVKKPVQVVAGPAQAFTDEEILTGIEGPSPSVLRSERVEQKVSDMVRSNPRDAANMITRWVQSEG